MDKEHIKANINLIYKKLGEVVVLPNALSYPASFGAKVILIAVTKKQTIDTIQNALDLGFTNFGENYVQEALEKWPLLKKNNPHISLHLIGALQSNKITKALELFDTIQTLDSIELVLKIKEKIIVNNLQNKSFFIQVNFDDNSKVRNGVKVADLEGVVKSAKGLNVRGLMIILPLIKTQETKKHFILASQLNKKYGFKELSMGMSADYIEAIKCGSSMIRLGKALF
ncbi:Yggs family pyridoxal phosphate-dependent enzyme [Candidatus Hepatincolaceae symbiont of Richtersius coronifer]